MQTLNEIRRLQKNLSQSIIGQDNVVERLLIAILADGHVLMEGLPGVAKTRSIKTLSQLVESDFRRVQFTPDLLPSDIVGVSVYSSHDQKLTFHRGPVFTHLLLADEL
ncbi:MAG TPA: AAA family ATPase, partial [Planctomycetaceae bacterium]|nr:AAA family ATPase [Planctomycetaceae bacterium]